MAEETKKEQVEPKEEKVEEKEEKRLSLKFESTVKALGLDGPEVKVVEDISQFEIKVRQGEKEFVVGRTLVE